MLFINSVAAYGARGDKVESYFLKPRDRDIGYLLGIDYFPKHLSSYVLKYCGQSNEQFVKLAKSLCPFFVDKTYGYYINKTSVSNLENLIKSETDILIFGETHNEKGPKEFLTEQLSNAKEMGFKALFLEMFNQEDQKYLTQFLESKIDAHKLKEVLNASWSHHHVSDDYVALVVEAKRLELEVFALDQRKESSLVGLGRSENLIARDKIWSQRIMQVMNDKFHCLNTVCAKSIVFSGRLHAFKSFYNTSNIKGTNREREVKTVHEQLKESDANVNIVSTFFVSRPENFIYGAAIKEESKQLRGIFKFGSELLYFDSAVFDFSKK